MVHVVAVERRDRKEEVGRTDAVIMGSTMPDDRKDLDKEENEENLETLGLSMEFFKYGAVMPPKFCDVSKMTV